MKRPGGIVKKFCFAVGALLGVLVVLLLMGPGLASTGLVKRWILREVNAGMKGQLDVEAWSLSWRGPLRAHGVRYVDVAGGVTAQLESVQISEGLLALRGQQKRLGDVALQSPVLILDVSTTNAVAAPPAGEGAQRAPQDGIPEPAAKPRGPGPERVAGPAAPAFDLQARISITDGRITTRDAVSGATLSTLAVEGEVEVMRLNAPITFTLAASPEAGTDGATLTAKGTMTFQDGELSREALTGEIDIQARQFDLVSLGSLRAFVPTIPPLSGVLDGTARLKVEGPLAFAADARLGLQNLRTVDWPSVGDAIDEEHVAVNVDLRVGSGTLDVTALGVTGASLNVTGGGKLKTGGGAPEGRVQLDGSLDVARLARQVPSLLRLHDDLVVGGGRVTLKVLLEASDDAVRMTAASRLEDLVAVRGTESLRLDTPVLCDIVLLRLPGQGTEMHELRLVAQGLTVTGEAAAGGGQARLEAQLPACLDGIGQFVDLGALSGTGELKGMVRWHPGPKGLALGVDAIWKDAGLENRATNAAVQGVSGQFQMKGDLRVGRDGSVDALSGFFKADGMTLWGGAFKDERVSVEDVRLEYTVSEADGVLELQGVNLQLPFARFDVTGRVSRVGVMAGRLEGDLRLAANIDLPMMLSALPEALNPLQAETRVVTGKARVTAHAATANSGSPGWQATFMLEQFEGMHRGTPFALSEPAAVTARGRLEPGDAQLEVLELTSAFGTASARLSNRSIAARAQIDLGGMTRSLGPVVPLGDVRCEGKLSLDAGVELPGAGADGPRLQWELSGEIQECKVSHDMGAWTDGATVYFGSVGHYLEDVITFSTRLESEALGLYGHVELRSIEARRHAVVNGTLRGDWAKLTALYASITEKPLALELEGTFQHPFALESSWPRGGKADFLANSRGSAELAVERARFLGMDAADLDVSVEMADGRAEFVVDTMVNGGRLALRPGLSADAEGVVLAIPTNTALMRGVALNDALASELLSRVHPVLRGAAVLGGTMDVDLASFTMPLGERWMNATRFEGDLVLSDVVFAPSGPLKDVVSVFDSSKVRATIETQTVHFVCADGRVHPSPLTVQADKVTIEVTGSVGLDETVAYFIEVPVTEALVGRDVYPYVEGIEFKVPVGGTIRDPDLSTRSLKASFRDLRKRAVRQAAEEGAVQLLEGLLKR